MKNTITTVCTKTLVYTDDQVTPFTGIPILEIRSKHKERYYNKKEYWRDGLRLVTVETMDIRTWSIHAYDHDNKLISQEDHTGFWFEKRYHPIAGLTSYRDFRENFMVMSLNKEGTKVLSYTDSKGRVLVHDDSVNMIIYDKSKNMFISRTDEREMLSLDRLKGVVNSIPKMDSRMSALLSIKTFLGNK